MVCEIETRSQWTTLRYPRSQSSRYRKLFSIWWQFNEIMKLINQVQTKKNKELPTYESQNLLVIYSFFKCLWLSINDVSGLDKCNKIFRNVIQVIEFHWIVTLSAARSALGRSRHSMTTSAPRRYKSLAVANPIPLLAPKIGHQVQHHFLTLHYLSQIFYSILTNDMIMFGTL